MKKSALAAVKKIRQETQFTCMAASLASAMAACGKEITEADVNRVMGASPLRGASWEDLLATAQYFGMVGRLIVPATLEMLRDWTDQKLPVVIAWNPENRPWAHASVVFHVDDEDNVHIMDPNIPDPKKTVRIVSKEQFFKCWGEKVSDSLIMRRPACFIDREITPQGRQVYASKKTACGDGGCSCGGCSCGGKKTEKTSSNMIDISEYEAILNKKACFNWGGVLKTLLELRYPPTKYDLTVETIREIAELNGWVERWQLSLIPYHALTDMIFSEPLTFLKDISAYFEDSENFAHFTNHEFKRAHVLNETRLIQCFDLQAKDRHQFQKMAKYLARRIQATSDPEQAKIILHEMETFLKTPGIQILWKSESIPEALYLGVKDSYTETLVYDLHNNCFVLGTLSDYLKDRDLKAVLKKAHRKRITQRKSAKKLPWLPPSKNAADSIEDWEDLDLETLEPPTT